MPVLPRPASAHLRRGHMCLYSPDKAAQGALVAGWIARTSVAIQRAQFRLVSRMHEQARSANLEGDVPNEWRMPDLDDLDARPVRNR